jgi:hypothetical protein
VKKDLPIEVDLIEVEYISKYPALGIHYLHDQSPDYGEYIEEESEKIIQLLQINVPENQLE